MKTWWPKQGILWFQTITMLTYKLGLLEYILFFVVNDGIFNANEGCLCMNTVIYLSQAQPRTVLASWPWGTLSHWVPAYHLTSLPARPASLRHTVPLSPDDQALSNVWAPTGAVLSPWNTLPPLLTHSKGTPVGKPWLAISSDVVPLLFPSWRPVTFLVLTHTLSSISYMIMGFASTFPYYDGSL